MPLEFVAKKGFTTPQNASVSGSLTVLGTTSLQGLTGRFTGSHLGDTVGTSSWASSATSASYAPGSPSVSASYAVTASYALTGGSGGETAIFTGRKQITGSLNVTNSITIFSGGTQFPLQIINTLNNESEVINTNLSAGNTASSDFVAFNDLGSAASYQSVYGVDLGINSSGYNYGFIGIGNDSYLFATGSQSSSLYIGHIDTTGSMYLWAGSATNTGSGLIIKSGSIQSAVPFTASAIQGTSSWAINSISSSYLSQSVGTASVNTRGIKWGNNVLARSTIANSFEIRTAADTNYADIFCGTLQIAGGINAASSFGLQIAGGLVGIVLNSGKILNFQNKTDISSSAIGQLTFKSYNADDFDKVQFGGTGNTFPALKKTGSNFAVVLADDSALTSISASTFYGTAATISGSLMWGSRSKIYSPTDGIVRFTNNAGDDFLRLNLGGDDVNSPGLQRNGSSFQLVKADGSGFTDVQSALLTCTAITASLSIKSPTFFGTATTSSYLRADAGGTSLTAGNISSTPRISIDTGTGTSVLIHQNGITGLSGLGGFQIRNDGTNDSYINMSSGVGFAIGGTATDGGKNILYVYGNTLVNAITSSAIQFSTASVPAYREGTLFYDSSSYTMAYYNENSSVTQNIGQETWIRVYNSSSNTITNASPVYLSASTNNYPNAWNAIADGLGVKFNVAGVATVDILTGSYGYITAKGRVNSINLNLPVGSDLWLSPFTAGGYQITRPTGSFEQVKVGMMVKSGSNAGTMLVNIDATPNQFTSSISGSVRGPNAATAWIAFSVGGAATLTNNANYNMPTFNRVGVGIYRFGFGSAITTPYSIVATAASASTNAVYNLTGGTGSVCVPFGLTNTGFTMSFCLASAATTANDPRSGSIAVYTWQ